MTRDLVDIMGGGHGFAPKRIGDEETQPGKYYDLEVVLHHDTGRAILISETGEETTSVFLPKHLCEIHPVGKHVPAIRRSGERVILPVFTITIPEWLAAEKGLI